MKVTPQRKKTRSPQNRENPYGRDEVKQAILDAAENLMMKKSPSQISVREIAELAKVNHSLLHRHFETKENVIKEVYKRIVFRWDGSLTEVKELDGSAELLFNLAEKNHIHRLLLTRALLDGIDPHTVQKEFPVTQRLLKLIEQKKASKNLPSEYDAKTLTAFITATVNGYFLFEPFLFAAVEIDVEEKENLKKNIIKIIEEVVEKFC